MHAHTHAHYHIYTHHHTHAITRTITHIHSFCGKHGVETNNPPRSHQTFQNTENTPRSACLSLMASQPSLHTEHLPEHGFALHQVAMRFDLTAASRVLDQGLDSALGTWPVPGPSPPCQFLIMLPVWASSSNPSPFFACILFSSAFSEY